MCLKNNRFGDKEPHLFASALRSNCYLRELNLQKNSIGARGKASLMRALCDTSSLNAVADSNHACLVRLGEDGAVAPSRALPVMVEAVNNTKNPYFGTRKRKIHATMLIPASSGLPKLKYFEDVSVGLMPAVLALAQDGPAAHGRNRCARTFVFELLRGTGVLAAISRAPGAGIARKRKYAHFVGVA